MAAVENKGFGAPDYSKTEWRRSAIFGDAMM
jgi:hypothetical protein